MNELIDLANKKVAVEVTYPNFIFLWKWSERGISTRQSGKGELQWMKKGIQAINMMPKKQMPSQDSFVCHRQGSVDNLLLYSV